MKIIISPAKKMKEGILECLDLPVFEKYSEKIAKYIRHLSYEDAKKIWKANDAITMENIERFKNMNLKESLTPAIFSYEGIQYQYISGSSLSDEAIGYLQKNLRILSGFYGVLKPLDGIRQYRLEMKSRIDMDKFSNLYDFWKDMIYKEILDDSRIIINLASKEYSKCVEKYLKKEDVFITCNFYELSDAKLAQKGTYAKMARGQMVRFMAENKIENVEDIKKFEFMGYKFSDAMSNNREYVFIKENF